MQLQSMPALQAAMDDGGAGPGEVKTSTEGASMAVKTTTTLLSLLRVRSERSAEAEEKVEWVRSQLVGRDVEFDAPFGRRALVYADHTASGRSLRYIEDYILKHVLPFYAAHTVGTTACFFIQDRLYNFPLPGGGRGSDPSIPEGFLAELKSRCAPGDLNTRLPLDRGSERVFDTSILRNIRNGFAVIASDAALYNDTNTVDVVDSYSGLLSTLFGPYFRQDFADAMVKMGSIGVLTGRKGEVRKVCSKFN